MHSEPNNAGPFGEHIEDMPEPQEHAIASEQAEEAEAVKNAGDARDKQGNSFDPDIHVTDDHGNPAFNIDGSLKRKRGRKKGAAAANSYLGTAGAERQDREPDKATEAAGPDYRAAATGIVSVHYALSAQLGGGAEELRKGEFEEGVSVWERYCEAKGMQDFPPGVAVTFWSLSFFMARYQQRKQFQENVKGIGGKLKGGIRKLRERMANRRKKKQAKKDSE